MCVVTCIIMRGRKNKEVVFVMFYYIALVRFACAGKGRREIGTVSGIQCLVCVGARCTGVAAINGMPCL